MQGHITRWIVAIAAISVVVGCSDNSSSQSADDKWLEAPAVLSLYLANTDLIMSGRDKEGCPVVIEDVRKGLDDPSNFGTQGLLQICSNSGMEFGGDVRCKDKRLQVKCR
jgi:predicted component of type VI protein secretion system